MSEIAGHLGENLRLLRAARGLTQQEVAKLSGLPRATWANLESGASNPTLAVLHRAAVALQVSIEELLQPPRARARYYPKGALPVRTPGGVSIRRLLPDKVAGMEIDRIEVPPRGRLSGVPHTPGTREYLTCESGELVLTASTERFRLSPGDVVVFPGDQRHSYENPTAKASVGYSIVILAPAL